ncbi:MAG TPA: hypothetical protein ACFE0H_07705, partial [Elainellaceae cyanobacterium]
IRKLLGGIFGFIKGIFGFLGGLLGIGKSSGYFLELDDSQDAPKPNANTKNDGAASQKKSATSATSPAQAKPTQSEAQPPVPAAKPSTPQPAPSKPQPMAQPKPAQVAASSSKPEPELKTFAPDFMLSLSTKNGRRRPGPSMNPFLDMAKDMKSPGRA